MAQLTDQIGSTNSGRDIINPGPANPSFIGALADFGRQVVPGLAQVGREREAKRAGDALDQAAGIIRSSLLESGNTALNPQVQAPEYVQTGPVAISGELEGSGLPNDAVAVADDLRRAQAAVTQGRAPRASLEMRINQSVDELYARFPDQRAEIAQFMLSQGFNHYMYREAIEERARVEADAAARLNADTAPAQVAQAAGMVTPNMSLPEQAEIGRGILERKRRMEALQAQAEADRADAAIDREERNRREDRAGGEALGVVVEEVNAQIDPVLRNFEGLLSLAGTDAERQQVLSGTQTQVLTWLAGQERSAIAQVTRVGGPGLEDRLGAVRDMFKGYRESMGNIVNESFTANNRSMRNMQSWFSINAAQAAPMYSRMVALLGSNQAVNALFASPDGTLPFPPEFQQALTNEFRNFDPTTERGTLTLARLVGFMRGELGYKDLSAEEAGTFIASNARTLQANQQLVLEGNLAAVRPWAVNYANTAEAAVELAVTTAAPASIEIAAGLLAGPGAVRALDTLVQQDPEYGQAIAQASRAGATNLMLIGRQQLTRQTQGTPYVFEYRGDTTTGGNYVLSLSRADYDRWAAAQPRRQGGALIGDRTGLSNATANIVPSFEAMQQNIPDNLRRTLVGVNASLAHLANTSKYTDELPQGLTSRQVRAYYATGQLPAGVTAPASGNTRTGDQNFERQVTDFENSLKQDIGSNLERGLPETRTALQNRVVETARELGINEDVAFNIARIESNWNPNARNRTTGAQGLFQINDDRPRDLDANIRDGLGFVKNAIGDARRALGREPQGWEVYVAHQQGAAGGPALLNPANANRNAVEVLTPLYRNADTARQAVTANMGSADMTVREFLGVIRNFYNRD